MIRCCRFLLFSIVLFISDYCLALNYVVVSKPVDFTAQALTANTLYDIQCDVDLKGTHIIIPENCILKFTKGAFYNGILTGSSTYIENPSNLVIFTNIKIGQNPYQFINDRIYVDWFGGRDDSERIQAAIDFASTNKNPVYFLSREYVMSRTVLINTGQFMLIGSGAGGEYGDLGTKITATDHFVSDYAGKPLFYIVGNGKLAENKLGDASGRITGLAFTTKRNNDVFQFKLAGSPSRPFYIDHCSFLKCKVAIRVLDNRTTTALGFLYVENCTMKGNLWNIVARGRHALLGLYFCKNVAEQCDGNINLGFSETFTKTPFEKYAPKPLDYAGSATITICDNLLEGTVDCIYINGGKCVVNIERNYFETSRRQFIVLNFSAPNSTVSFKDNFISESEDVDLSIKNCTYQVQQMNKDRLHLINKY